LPSQEQALATPFQLARTHSLVSLLEDELPELGIERHENESPPHQILEESSVLETYTNGHRNNQGTPKSEPLLSITPIDLLQQPCSSQNYELEVSKVPAESSLMRL
jgi:hypothetical protein